MIAQWMLVQRKICHVRVFAFVSYPAPIAQIISGVCKEGYSRKEVEEVFNMMWSEGNDFENVDLAIQQIKERLGVVIDVDLHCLEKERTETGKFKGGEEV